MISVSELTKDYGTRRAISDLTFDINQGEIVGFLGPNGAGKTTTMRILTGYMPPTSGRASIAGYDTIEDSMEVRRIIGYLPETVPLYPEMTVFDYLQYMANLHNTQNAENKVDEILETVHMEDRANSFISSLSKGMRQRIGLAQALVHDPEVLILDEPSIGLDPGQIIEVRNLIRSIGKEHTVLLSTHILSEAQQLCDRVVIINEGKIVAEDTTERLQARLSGTQQIRIKVRGDIPSINSTLETVPGVLGVAPGDENTWECTVVPDTDARPEIARAIVSAGYDLLELQTTSLSLEDIFLQLTQDKSAGEELPVEGYK